MQFSWIKQVMRCVESTVQKHFNEKESAHHYAGTVWQR